MCEKEKISPEREPLPGLGSPHPCCLSPFSTSSPSLGWAWLAWMSVLLHCLQKQRSSHFYDKTYIIFPRKTLI